MRSNGYKIQGGEHPTTCNYKMSSLRCDQILVTQNWEVYSQSSPGAQIISATRLRILGLEMPGGGPLMNPVDHEHVFS